MTQSTITNYTPPCSVYKKCNGCQLMHLPYEKQLQWKENYVRKLFAPFCKVAPILGAKNPDHYRNKVQAVFQKTKQGQLLSGVYQSSRGGIVAVSHCLTEDQLASKIIVTIRQLLEKYRIPLYDKNTDTGFLKHVLIRVGKASGQILVALVANTTEFPKEQPFVERLRKAHPQITTVVLNVNPHREKLLLGTQERILYGDGKIYDTLCGKSFCISSRSFYQINHDQTEVLYRTAIAMAKLTKDDVVLDAYCGIGTIGIVASDYCKQVLAVESNEQAVKDAQVNLAQNHCHNVQITAADAGAWMTEQAEQGTAISVAFLDPPRAGCSKEFLLSLARLSPTRVVYISCNPETQVRDIRLLRKLGYKIEGMCQPVDLFPHTKHTEVISLLERAKA